MLKVASGGAKFVDEDGAKQSRSRSGIKGPVVRTSSAVEPCRGYANLSLEVWRDRSCRRGSAAGVDSIQVILPCKRVRGARRGRRWMQSKELSVSGIKGAEASALETLACEE